MYKKIEINYATNIVDVMHRLYREEEPSCAEFNGHILNSDMSIDEAYLEVVGKTKAQCDREHQEWLENYRREEQEHKAKIPELTKYWIAEGHKVLDAQYWDLWDKCVPVRLNDLYRGWELEGCLDIVRRLNEGCSFDEAKQIIESQGHSGMSWALMKAMVRNFCDRGQEFCYYID